MLTMLCQENDDDNGNDDDGDGIDGNDDCIDVADGRDDNDDVNEDVKRGAVLPPVLLTALLTVQMEPSIITHNGDDDVEE